MLKTAHSRSRTHLSALKGENCLSLCVCLLATFSVVPVAAEVVITSVQLRNQGKETVKALHLRVPFPVDTDYQRVRHVVIQPQPIETQDLPPDGRIAFLRFRNVAPGDSVWAFIAVHFEPRAFEPKEGLITRKLPRKVRQRCLGPSYKLDPSAPAIQELAEKTAPEETDPRKIIRAFLTLICDSFEYELDDQQEDVTAILASRKGSCSELSRVFVALCRARGLPARFASGTRLRNRDLPVYVDTVHHRWVEVFLPTYGWFPVDVSMAVSREDPDRRFGDIPARRLTMLRNAGIEDDFRYSSGLTLIEPEENIDRTLRSYWFKRSRRTIGKGLDVAARQLEKDWPEADVRDDLLDLKGNHHAIPFLAMGLYPPLADDTSQLFIDALANLHARAAILPLIDLATTEKALPPVLADVLEKHTKQRFASASQWQEWLRNDGLKFLRETPEKE